jgi:hypothetical protein
MITPHADVAEWQTRSAQDAVGAILWRFKSSHPHPFSTFPATVSLTLRAALNQKK